MSDLPPARVLDVEPDEYHKLPGFSASLARIIIAQSELHGKDAYDRNQERALADAPEAPDAEDAEEDTAAESPDEPVSPEKQKRLDRGDILHALVLGKGKRIEVIPSHLLGKGGKYTTAASKRARDDARAAGRIPVKEPDMKRFETIADVIKGRLTSAGHYLVGRSELAIEWYETTPHGVVQCRCMIDHLVTWGAGAPGDEPSFVSEYSPIGAAMYELKIVDDAHPERCQRTAENLGYAIACVAYRRALYALCPQLGGRIDFRYLWAEARRPYALWDPPPSSQYLEIGERRWVRARNAWAAGIESGRWPAYRTPQYCEMTAPSWTLRQEGYTGE